MAYYSEERLEGAAISERRPMINEYFLSSHTMAIYAGCEIGCPYCDGWTQQLRPFNETVRIPANLPDRLSENLAQLDRGDVIGITALTDPYQPAESIYRTTRRTLQVLAAAGQPCTIMTKSHTILDDLILLERIHAQSLALVMFTLLTTDATLAERLEGKAPVPALRLESVAALKRARIPVGVALMPIIPYVNDTEQSLIQTLRAIANAGADFVVWDFLHIPDERHRERVDTMLARVTRLPPSYYRDLYQRRPIVDDAYRADRNKVLLRLCDDLNLPVRAPHQLYAGRIAPRNEATLLLRHTAFRDAVQGRAHSAQRHRELAAMIYSGTVSEAALHGHPMEPIVRDILARG